MSLITSVCEFFKSNYLGLQKFLPLTQSRLSFAARIYGDLISLALEPWAGGPGVGLGLLLLEIALPNFYPPRVGVGPAWSSSPPFLPVWMDVVSLIPFNLISDGSQ